MPGGWAPSGGPNNWFAQLLAAKVYFSPQAKDAKAYETLQVLFGRKNSDDFLFMFLVLVNQYIRPVPEVRQCEMKTPDFPPTLPFSLHPGHLFLLSCKHYVQLSHSYSPYPYHCYITDTQVSMTTKGFDFDSIRCMVQHCRNQVMDCVNSPTCKAGLDCLQACTFNDQVGLHWACTGPDLHLTCLRQLGSALVRAFNNQAVWTSFSPTSRSYNPVAIPYSLSALCVSPLQACSPFAHLSLYQVCQYRCIVSYETPQMAEFSLCILQKHNCRNLDAKIPVRPDPAPMSSFRGRPLTHEVAEDIFVGWLDAAGAGVAPSSILAPGLEGSSSSPVASNAAAGGGAIGGEEKGGKLLPFSWLVAAGKNPAYDYFPSQHQIYYRDPKAKGAFWYEPVFKVVTLDGDKVWRRRRYRVRRAPTPGTFYFSVLDNGVVSKEYWRILDADEEGMSWSLYYYSGAAATAGMSYSGAILATRDGEMPADPGAMRRIEEALERAGIKTWELSMVDNTDREGAPLGLAFTPAAAVAAAV